MYGFEVIEAPRRRRGGAHELFARVRTRTKDRFHEDYPGSLQMFCSVVGRLREEGLEDSDIAEMVDWYVGTASVLLPSCTPMTKLIEKFQTWRSRHSDVLSENIYLFCATRSPKFDGPTHFRDADGDMYA